MSQRNDQGFSLVEMMVAVGIFGILILVSTLIFRNVQHAQKVATVRHNVEQTSEELLMYLQKDIMAMDPDERLNIYDPSWGLASRCTGPTCYIRKQDGGYGYYVTYCQPLPPKYTGIPFEPKNNTLTNFCVPNANCGAGALPAVYMEHFDPVSGLTTKRTYGKTASPETSAMGAALCFALDTVNTVPGAKPDALLVDMNVIGLREEASSASNKGLAWNYRKQQSFPLDNTSGVKVYRRR